MLLIYSSSVNFILFLFSFLATNSALARLLLLYSWLVNLNSSQFRVNHDTSTVFAHDDFLVHSDVQLALWGNLVKTTATCITLHINDANSIACILTNTLE